MTTITVSSNAWTSQLGAVYWGQDVAVVDLDAEEILFHAYGGNVRVALKPAVEVRNAELTSDPRPTWDDALDVALDKFAGLL